MSKTFTFKIGDHGLKKKRGHCTACSAVQATVTIEAESLQEAVERVNAQLAAYVTVPELINVEDDSAGIYVQFSFATTVTGRQLVKGA
jgi:nitrate reductase alpha subunit